ncbi:Hypp1488 [Branchiostoma lanceolatum]|uniref:Hypp1488 protein n=1 Tax=Branchiostoma lanceolatum TaxID=7740 RepID=A0A8J9ZI93_BRALA|nr:Hypp1488 [Branchiostoma lanceolatum]
MKLFGEATVVVVSLLCVCQGQGRSRLSFPRMRGRMLLPEPGLQLCRPSPCALQCEYGREIDARGCAVCRCQAAPEIPTTDNPADLEQTAPVPLDLTEGDHRMNMTIGQLTICEKKSCLVFLTVPSDFGEFCRQEQNSNLSSCLLQSERPDDFTHYITRFGLDAFGVDPEDYANLTVPQGNDTKLSIHPQSGLESLNPCARESKFVNLRTARNRKDEEVELWVGSDRNGRTKLQLMHEVRCRSATPVHHGCGTASAGGFCTEEKTLQRAYVISKDTLKPRPDWIYVKTSCSCHVEGLG